MKGPLAVAWGDWTLAEPHAGSRHGRPGRAREHGHRRVARPGAPLLPLARPAPQPDRLGRRTDEPAARRARRARHRRGEGAGSDPSGPVPLRPRSRRGVPGVVLRARERARLAGDRRAPSRRARIAPTFRPGSSRRRTGRSGSRRRTPRGTPLSPDRSSGGAASPGGGRRRWRRTPRAPGRIPGFAHPLVCPSVLDGIELERLPDVAGLPAFAAPADEPWVYDGRVVLRARPA